MIVINNSVRDQRGQAVSVMMLGVFAALILVAGLVIDGGQKASAISRAETVAAGAARAAVNAGAGGTLDAGTDQALGVSRARRAAQDYLDASAQQGESLHGTVTVSGARVRVHTRVEVATVFLSVIGIDRLHATGQASARIVPNR
jgi:hypothetical protein